MPGGRKIAKPIPLDLTPSDESEDDDPSSTSVNDDENDDIPDPDRVLDSFSNNLQE